MVHSTTALAVFTAAILSSTTLVSAHRDALGSRHAHTAPHKKAAAAVADAARSLIPDMEKIRRGADDLLARSTGSTSQKKKRKVKKRKNTCVPQQGFNVSTPSTSAASWSASSTGTGTATGTNTASASASNIGNEWGVSATESATSTSSSAPAASSSSSSSQYNSKWTLEDTWVSSRVYRVGRDGGCMGLLTCAWGCWSCLF